MTVIQVKPEEIFQKQWLSYQTVRGSHGNAKPSVVHKSFQGVTFCAGQHESSCHTTLEQMHLSQTLHQGEGDVTLVCRCSCCERTIWSTAHCTRPSRELYQKGHDSTLLPFWTWAAGTVTMWHAC